MFMIEIKDLRAGFFGSSKVNVLKGINFTLDGEKAVIVGPNGSGKTAMIRVILGMLHIRSGEIRLNQRDLTHIKNMVEISANLPEIYRMMNIPARELISLYAELYHSDKHVFLELIDEFDLSHILHKKMHAMSTGEQKMFCNIMAIGSGAKTILLDEPFESIDQARKMKLLEKLLDFQGEILLNTHEFLSVKRLSGWSLYFILNGNLYGKFSTEDLQRLYFSSGKREDAIKVIHTDLGDISITLDSGDIKMSDASGFDMVMEMIP